MSLTTVWRRPLLTFVQLLPALALPFLFFAWASWFHARPIDEAPPDVVAELPPGCPAYVVSHGDYSCVTWGMPADAPVKFGLLTAAFIGDLGLSLATLRSRARIG